MSGVRLGFGLLLIIAAPIVIAAGYANKPSASACSYINQVNTSLGNPATCSTTPGTGYFVAAAILGAAGLLFTAPWWLRWIAGKKMPG
jgi:hypothetical protein